MTSTYLSGTLPDLSQLISLKMLDLSYNYFMGKFPLSVNNLTNLELLNFNENSGVNFWQLPDNFSKLTKLKYMILSTCKIHGQMPAFIGNMTSLVDLDLSGNFFTCKIPAQIGLLKNLQMLELYYNQLVGEIPKELGNLTAEKCLILYVAFQSLREVPKDLGKWSPMIAIDLSENQLSGELPTDTCIGGKLLYFCALDNMFSGGLQKLLEAAYLF
ncbi:hypothetical protein POM88_008223 [Heracleum sosnowskyi]|uniref:Uncharacterized protein n=1 Tax=Heracleum sosnowskyi TaxID=360622 RepID=A0AAD8J5T3_9APIA|nr:hypothetical protein POM88_008223 [Heracleum sosnowskyi]